MHHYLQFNGSQTGRDDDLMSRLFKKENCGPTSINNEKNKVITIQIRKWYTMHHMHIFSHLHGGNIHSMHVVYSPNLDIQNQMDRPFTSKPISDKEATQFFLQDLTLRSVGHLQEVKLWFSNKAKCDIILSFIFILTK